MRKFIFTATFFLIFVGSIFGPTSAYPEFFSDNYGLPRQKNLVVGETTVLSVSNPKRIAIGDPSVVDVASASGNEILISAKKEGETNLQIWDDAGQREISLRVFIEDLNKLKDRLDDLFATASVHGINFQVGEQERKIFVLGDLPQRKKELVDGLLGGFKDKIINLLTYSEDYPLVEIDVQVLEIAKFVVDQLGIDWTPSFAFAEAAAPAAHTLSRQVGDLLKAIGQAKFNRGLLTATLKALETDNLARTLSRPKLVALSGKEAKFLVGGQVPILSSVSTVSGTTTTEVTYVDYGVKLNIRPQVKENGDIACKLEVEVKSVDTEHSLTVGTTTTPSFKSRNASTELYLKNNQTIFLAGLISNDESNNLSRVPGINNIPIIGALFRSKEFQDNATELVISITPAILNYGDMRKDIKDSAAMKKVSEDEAPADTYARTIQEMILKSVSYPMEARRANLSGQVVLSLHLLSSGQLLGVVISESSGHKLLDGAATYTAKKLAPYPAFPKGLLLKEIWVEVPITYQLD